MKKLINFQPQPSWRLLLGLLPFVVVLIIYSIGSDARLLENPNDKLLPSFEQMGNAIQRMAFEPSKRSGEYLFWVDTTSSLIRLSLGVFLAAILGLVIGIVIGALPVMGAGFSPFLTVISLVPPLALLPILFIVFGLGELSKVVLIMVGITPLIARDIQGYAQEIPREQIIKAQTLGGNTIQIILRVILPQLLPRLISSVRLAMGTAWLFLIAAEAVASTDGLGYRIFLVRRYLAMDVILPYVAWITLLAFFFDVALVWLSRKLFPWHHEGGASS